MKKAAYVALGVKLDGTKDIFRITVVLMNLQGFDWQVLNVLKNRGMKGKEVSLCN